jgi:hypothetical protein
MGHADQRALAMDYVDNYVNNRQDNYPPVLQAA